MNKLTAFIKSPFHWFILVILINTIFKLSDTKNLQQSIRSDGRGYYAYLPAVFIYNDPTFQKSLDAEIRNAEWKGDPLYLYTSENGSVYNKYFPGITILQAPFFGLACMISWMTNSPIDGYSNIFHFWYLIGSFLYGFLAILLFRKLMRELYPDKKKAIDWWIPTLFLTTTLVFYVFETPSFTHHYSFFLFSVASLISLKLSRTFSSKYLFVLGVLFGLIFLVRPTNILFLLFLPFLFKTSQAFLNFWRQLFANKVKGLFSFSLGFFAMSFALLLVWKWESGSWILWSYSGEGFNFSSPKIWQNLFSWRVGLLIHTPILILSSFGLYRLFKKSRFHASIWFIYFAIVLYVISAWWCWDYESFFGNRPFTEHIAFLLIPVFLWLTQLKKNYAIPLLILFVLAGAIRFFEIKSGAIGDQRFVSGRAYFSSLAFWGEQNQQRYNFGRSCVPFGKMVDEKLVLSQIESFNFSADNLFGLSNEIELPTITKDDRYYYRVNMDKWQNNADFNEVYLVIDAFSKDMTKRYYKAIPLYHDRLEAKQSWKTLEFTGLIEDNFKIYQNIKMYIWNPGKKLFKLKNVRYALERYVP